MKLRERYRRLSFWNKLATWGSLASIIGLLVVVITYVGGINSLGQYNSTSSDQRIVLRKKLLKYVKELNAIETNWDTEYYRVEFLADRVASVLEKQYPKPASAITTAQVESSTARKIAYTMRLEINKVLDQIDVETHQ